MVSAYLPGKPPSVPFRKRKRLKFLYQRNEWIHGNGNVISKAGELEQTDKKEFSFLFN